MWRSGLGCSGRRGLGGVGGGRVELGISTAEGRVDGRGEVADGRRDEGGEGEGWRAGGRAGGGKGGMGW